MSASGELDYDKVLLGYSELSTDEIRFRPMIVRHEYSDLFELDVDAICHGINTKGTSGGLAGVVFQRYPETYEAYLNAVEEEALTAGEMLVTFENDKWVYNLVTQVNPGADAKLEYISDAFAKMKNHATVKGVRTIGCPLIGSGIGGLNWIDVERKISGEWGVNNPNVVELHIVSQHALPPRPWKA